MRLIRFFEFVLFKICLRWNKLLFWLKLYQDSYHPPNNGFQSMLTTHIVKTQVFSIPIKLIVGSLLRLWQPIPPLYPFDRLSGNPLVFSYEYPHFLYNPIVPVRRVGGHKIDDHRGTSNDAEYQQH